MRCLEVLQEQTEDPILAEITSRLARRIQQGYTLSTSLNQYPQVFPHFFVRLVSVGENTGRLVAAIDHLADTLEKEHALSQKVQAALIYPAFVIAVTCILTILLFRTVLPGFMSIFDSFGVPLPWITRLVMFLTALSASPKVWLLGAAMLLTGAVAFRRWLRAEKNLLLAYRALVLVPILGGILHYTSLARFCWILALTLETGLSLLKAVALAGEASGSPTLRHDLPHLLDNLQEGEEMGRHFASRPHLYPSLLAHFVNLGEESSNLVECVRRAGSWFESEVEERIELFKASLEPLLMGFVSLMVGTIVLAVFLPLYGFLDKLGE